MMIQKRVRRRIRIKLSWVWHGSYRTRPALWRERFWRFCLVLLQEITELFCELQNRVRCRLFLLERIER